VAEQVNVPAVVAVTSAGEVGSAVTVSHRTVIVIPGVKSTPVTVKLLPGMALAGRSVIPGVTVKVAFAILFAPSLTTIGLAPGVAVEGTVNVPERLPVEAIGKGYGEVTCTARPCVVFIVAVALLG
jgi:hypothetical protein